jgi:hypothetical protein
MAFILAGRIASKKVLVALPIRPSHKIFSGKMFKGIADRV